MTEGRQNVSPRFATVDDTTWPIYDGEVEWALRYANGELSREEQLHTASVLSAYEHLTDPARAIGETVDALRRARWARGMTPKEA